MNDENLIPNSKRTPSEVRENARKGGIASGEARRRKRNMREWAEILSAQRAKDRKGNIILDDDGEALTRDANVVNAQLSKAEDGDTNAARFVASLLGDLEDKTVLSFEPINLEIAKDAKTALDEIAKK